MKQARSQRALDSLGLTYEALREANPKIIYAVCSGFGPVGPDAAKKGFDGAAQARGGIVSITGVRHCCHHGFMRPLHDAKSMRTGAGEDNGIDHNKK